MAEPRTPRRGRAHREGAGSGEESERESSFGFAGDAKRFFKGILTEDLADTLVELSADAEVRDRAESFGVSAADAAWASPPLRAKLALVPNIILRVGTPVFATVVAREVVQGLDRPAEWAREFAQGFARRIRELKEARGGASADVADATTAPAVVAGLREMPPAELLNAHPDIFAVLDRGLSSLDPAVQQLAAEVQADIHRHLNYAHEGVTLSALPPLPPPPFDTTLNGHTVRQNVVTFVETHVPATERPTFYEELRKRVTTSIQLIDLLAAHPVVAPTAPMPIDFTKIGDKVDWLRGVYPDPTDFADVLRRLASHVAHDDRKAFLFSAPADAGLPAAVSTSAAWSEFTTTVVDAAPDEALALIAEAEMRVATVPQAQGLTAPPAGTAQLSPVQLTQRILALPKRTVALTQRVLEERLSSLELMHPAATAAARPPTLDDVRARLLAIPERKTELTLDLLQSRMVLIKDARQNRIAAPLHQALARVSAIVGGPDQAVVALDQTAGALANIRTRLFG